MVLIGIGGSGSGSGKTTAACALIRALSSDHGLRVGAMKCEPVSLYASVADEPEVIGEPGKDTTLMKEAGADEVLLVRAPRHDMEEALDVALQRLSGCDVLVVEGNSAVEVLKPDIVLFITGLSGTMPPDKQSAARVLAMADVVVHGGQPPPGAPDRAQKYSRGESGQYTARLISLIKGV